MTTTNSTSEREQRLIARTGQCFKCGLESDAEGLFVKRRFGRPYCRACRNKDQSTWRAKQPAPRRRNPAPERAAVKRYAQKHPERHAAWTAVLLALRKGKLIKPTNCQRCSQVMRLEGHHHDYSKPLEVEWLCRKCHRERDGRIAA